MNQELSTGKSAGEIKRMEAGINYRHPLTGHSSGLKLILVLLLLWLTSGANAQLYYGASAGVGIGKYYSAKTEQIKTGINDLYLSVPIGYTAHGVLAELQLQITASNNESVSLMAGYKVDFSDNAGVHLLGGYTDALAFKMKPFTVQHSLHATGTVRLWWGQAMLQGTYFNRQMFIGIGVVGFWERVY